MLDWPVNDESRSANENKTHTHRQGLGEVGRPFHVLEETQTVDSVSIGLAGFRVILNCRWRVEPFSNHKMRVFMKIFFL